MKKQQYVTKKKVCILCNKKNHKHSEKLLKMHETALLRGSKGKKLASLQIGFGPKRPAYIIELNADSAIQQRVLSNLDVLYRM